MPTMLLVEDESFERSSLIHSIDWELIGVQIVGEACNGAQGLSAAMELHPDIVLTDVKMPVMDGIELSKRIRAILPDTKIIFFSSYDDFEFARQAIDLNIAAYIMKPINESELLNVVKRAADESMKDKLEQRMQKRLQSNYSVSASLAQQALVNRLLMGMSVGEEDTRLLGLEWLFDTSMALCLYMCAYRQGDGDTIERDLGILNRHCKRVCNHVTSVCIHVGMLVTLCAFTHTPSRDELGQIESILRQFFMEKDADKMQIDYLVVDQGEQSISSLYKSLSDRYIAGGLTARKSEKRKNKQQIVDEIVTILQTEYSEPISIEMIANRLHFTPNYIGSIFKSAQRISINRYLAKIRLENAREMLKNTEIPITEIAESCGYGSITYFHTVFKRETGLTPNEYRMERVK